ncbi:MAG: TolC family protein [Elusimicrobia bacterium]|nr:TolC family protein [Elusimicrobiota bacterium]
MVAAVIMWAAVGARAETSRATVVGVRQAIAAAIETNLASKLARADSEAARAQVVQAASRLLPSLLGTASQGRTYEENLGAAGLGGGPIPSMIGPFDTFDARLHLTQTLFDLSFVRRYQAAGAARELAARQEEVVREQLAAAAALSYVEAQRARKSVEAATADDSLAASLLTLAQDQNQQGLATGVDVVRAKARASSAAVALLQTQVARRNADLKLKRLAGWPLSEEIALSDELRPTPLELPALERALSEAASARPEIAAAEEELRFANLTLGASQAERAPSLVAGAHFGLSGSLPDGGARRTGGVGVGLSLPLFTGGRIQGRIDESKSRLHRSEARLADIRAQVEEDVRLAYQDATEAQEQVAASAQTEDLAEQELRMAQDQYAAGTIDNVAVTTAQTELAQARDAYVSSLARDYDVRINLASALGAAQKFGF